MTNVQVNYWANKEQARHNAATEAQARNELAEITRHNKVGETISAGSLQESIRHNKATESEMHRHNVAGENISWSGLEETKRHNKAQESIAWAGNQLGWANLKETHRRNDASIALDTARTELTNYSSQMADYDTTIREANFGEELLFSGIGTVLDSTFGKSGSTVTNLVSTFIGG